MEPESSCGPGLSVAAGWVDPCGGCGAVVVSHSFPNWEGTVLVCSGCGQSVAVGGPSLPGGHIDAELVDEREFRHVRAEAVVIGDCW